MTPDPAQEAALAIRQAIARLEFIRKDTASLEALADSASTFFQATYAKGDLQRALAALGKERAE